MIGEGACALENGLFLGLERRSPRTLTPGIVWGEVEISLGTCVCVCPPGGGHVRIPWGIKKKF